MKVSTITKQETVSLSYIEKFFRIGDLYDWRLAHSSIIEAIKARKYSEEFEAQYFALIERLGAELHFDFFDIDERVNFDELDNVRSDNEHDLES